MSEYDWIRETDWLRLLVDECRDRGMAVGAEVSHFPIPQGELANHPEWRQKDIFGEPRNKKQFCLHQPDVRHYLLALFGDLAANYDLDYIQTCQYLYPSQDIDEGGSCFCEHCIAAAKKTGFDLEAAIPILRENKNAQPQRRQWEQFRFDSVTKLYQDLAETIHKEDRNCQLRLNDVFSWRRRDPRQRAMDIGAIAEHLDSIVNQDHDEQFGAAKADFEARAEWIAMNRKHLGFDKTLVSGIAPRMNATPELVKEGIRVAIQLPARINGLALKHYDGASFSLMRAFKQGMIDAGVRGLIPTLGKEVEEMELDGYVPFDEELAEEWGVRTTGTGTASYAFELPSGLYDVRITYFDAPSGQSKVRLEIDGKETASFTMNEDCDCWRRRRFENISIKRGDRVCLSGAADGKEQAMLDHIEFIPTAD